MLEKLAAIEAKYSQIEARLAAPETYDASALCAFKTFAAPRSIVI